MRKTIVAGLALMALVAFAGASRPAATSQRPAHEIRCPVGEIRAEITTTLPSPWWQTPQTGRLLRTRVATIGGKRTLVCEYEAYGRSVGVMREYPEGVKGCRALDGGFNCS